MPETIKAPTLNTALDALLSRNVWDDENVDGRWYIAGAGYDDHEVQSICDMAADYWGVPRVTVTSSSEVKQHVGGHVVTVVLWEPSGDDRE